MYNWLDSIPVHMPPTSRLMLFGFYYMKLEEILYFIDSNNFLVLFLLL